MKHTAFHIDVSLSQWKALHTTAIELGTSSPLTCRETTQLSQKTKPKLENC